VNDKVKELGLPHVQHEKADELNSRKQLAPFTKRFYLFVGHCFADNLPVFARNYCSAIAFAIIGGAVRHKLLNVTYFKETAYIPEYLQHALTQQSPGILGHSPVSLFRCTISS
jgi:hypothetical protein